MTQERKMLNLAAIRCDVKQVPREHPYAEDPGKDNGLSLEFSSSSEGAQVGPWDPWGETSEGQNLRDQETENIYI